MGDLTNISMSEFLQLKSAFGIDTYSDHNFGFLNNNTIFYLAGSNLMTYNLENMKHRFFSFKCSGRIKFVKITNDSKYAIMVDFDQKNSTIQILDLVEAEKKKPIKKSNIIENDLVSICVSNDQELIACVTNGWSLIILSFEKLRFLDHFKLVSTQNTESTVEHVSFFPNENKRLLVLGNKLIKILLYTKKGLKLIYNLDCDFFLLNICWLSKTEAVSYDKFANLFLIEPKQTLIRTIVLKNLSSNDVESQSNLVKYKSDLSAACSLANTSIELKKLEKTSIHSYEPSSKTILKASRLDSNHRQKTNFLYQINSSSIKCLVCARKGFFMCFQNDDRIFYYENNKTMYTYYQHCIMRLKKNQKYKLVDQNFKEIIVNMQINQSHSYLVALTNRKIVYQCDLSDFFVNNYKEIELEPVMDNYFSDSVVGIDYCVRKSLVVLCTSDKWLIIWNYDNNSIEMKQNFDEELLTVAFHPSGLYIILSGTNSLKFMSVYLESCKVIHVLNVHSCKNCIFSNGGHLFALIHGTIIQVYSSVRFNEIGSIKSQDMGKIKQLRFSKDDHYLLCCSMAGIIRIWNSQSLNLITEITTKGLSYIGLDLHPNQEWLFLISTEKNIRQFQIIVSEEYRNLIKPNAEPVLIQKFSTKPDENVTCIEISKSGKILCIGTNKGSLRVYLVANFENYFDYRAHYGSVNKICITFADECLITCADDGSVAFWNISNKAKETFSELVQLNEEILIDKDEYRQKSAIIYEYESKLKDSRIETNFKLRMKELKFNVKVRELKSRFNSQMIDLIDKIESLKKEDELKLEQFNLEFDELIGRHLIEYQNVQDFYENKILFEEKKNAQIEYKIDKLELEIKLNKKKIDDLELYKKTEQDDMLEDKLAQIRLNYQKEFLYYENMIEDLLNFGNNFEYQIEKEIDLKKTTFEKEILKMISEAQVLKSYLSDLRSEFSTNKNSAISFIQNEYKPEHQIKDLKSQIKALEKMESVLKQEMNDKELNIDNCDKEIKHLDAQCEQLSLINSDLEVEIKNLTKSLLEPARFENKQLNIVIDEIKNEIKQKKVELNKLKHEALQFRIKNRLRKK